MDPELALAHWPWRPAGTAEVWCECGAQFLNTESLEANQLGWAKHFDDVLHQSV